MSTAQERRGEKRRDGGLAGGVKSGTGEEGVPAPSIRLIFNILDDVIGIYATAAGLRFMAEEIYEAAKEEKIEGIPRESGRSWRMLNEIMNTMRYLINVINSSIGFFKYRYLKWMPAFIDKDVLERKRLPGNDAERYAVSVLSYLDEMIKNLDKLWYMLSPLTLEKVPDDEYFTAVQDIYFLTSSIATDAYSMIGAIEDLASVYIESNPASSPP